MNDTKITQAVESICAMGCSSVNAIIETIEAGNDVEGFDQYTDMEISVILKELKIIMAVYNDET